MQANKIKQHIQREQEQFEHFLTTIRKERLMKNKMQSNSQEQSHKQYDGSRSNLAIHSNIDKLGTRSLYLSKQHNTEINNSKYSGDQTLKMRGKYGVANRSNFKKFELPSQYFSPTKSKLQHHLRNSRMVPNVELLPNIKMDPTSKKYLFSQDEMSMLNESKVLRGQTNTVRLAQANPSIALKYCFIHELSESSDVKDILIFFVRLLQMLGYSLPEPSIEKYKDCIYFGSGIKKRQIAQGILYFFAGSLYLGDLLEYSMHGRGLQIFFHIPAVYKGDFKQNMMHGYFEVTKDNQKYSGMVENGVYHGHGRLVTRNGIVEGQYRQGKLVSVSKNLKEASIVKNHSNFKIRESFQRSAVEDYIEKSTLFDSLSTSIVKMNHQSKTIIQKGSPSKQHKAGDKPGKIHQFGYALDSKMIQRGTQQGTQQYYHKINRSNRNNPEIAVSHKKIQDGSKQRLNGYLAKSIQTIRQETELGQQQPLQFKC